MTGNSVRFSGIGPVTTGAARNSQFAEPCSIFFENHFGLRNSDCGKDNPPLEQLPEIDLHVDEANFEHLWVRAPARVLELDLARAHFGDPTEVYV